MVVVAQLVRALVCGAGCRGFESHLPPLKIKRSSLVRDGLFIFNNYYRQNIPESFINLYLIYITINLQISHLNLI